MRKLTVFSVCFFLIIQAGFCQFLVKGIVYSKEDNSPLPGVNIVEKGTQIGVVSSIEGEFTISVKDENAILVFSSVGFIRKEVPIKGQKNLLINLKPDCNVDFFDMNETSLYLSSGIINTPIGGMMEMSFPAYFQQSAIKFGLGYQTNLKENSLLNAKLAIDHLYGSCYYNLDLKLYLQSLSYNHEFEAGSYSIETYFRISEIPLIRRNLTVIIGYSKLNMFYFENSKHNYNSGMVIGLGTWIGQPISAQIIGKAAIYKDLIEYQAEISRYIKPVNVFIRYYQLDTFNELSIGVGKELYFKKRKRAKQ